MGFEINDTRSYHIDHLETLGWELTVCNALDPPDSPCRRALKRRESYGSLLYDHLDRFFPMCSLGRIIEIGGGYGYLMRDFLDRNPRMDAAMLDISPRLLSRQRNALNRPGIRFIEADIMQVSADDLRSYELAVLNENLGDLPTIVGIDREQLTSSTPLSDHYLELARGMIERYGIDPPRHRSVNLNIGAMKVLETLAQAGIPYIFMGEHSCEASAPEFLRRYVQRQPTGNPERIMLRGHDEYTIRFSDLEKIGRAFRYEVVRGLFANFLEIDFTDKLRYIMAAPSSHSDEHEILRHFIEDLCRYEYLILYKDRGTGAPPQEKPLKPRS